MNLEIGTEAAQFPEKEYVNGIAFAVYWLISIMYFILQYIVLYSSSCLLN